MRQRPQIEPEESELNTLYGVYGNYTANDCMNALESGHVVRLLLGESNSGFVADHFALPDGRIAMTASKFDPRTVFEATEAELGYGVATAHAYVYLPPERSLFATDLAEPRFSDGIAPEDVAAAISDDGFGTADLREGETRDDDNTHATRTEQQLAEADAETLAELEEDREVRTDGGQSPNGTQHVLECVYNRTSAEPDGLQSNKSNIWTGRNRMKADGSSSRSPLERADVDGVVSKLTERRDIFEWHGLLAPATREHLVAIIENEQQSDTPRKILIGKANRWLGELNTEDSSQ